MSNVMLDEKAAMRWGYDLARQRDIIMDAARDKVAQRVMARARQLAEQWQQRFPASGLNVVSTNGGGVHIRLWTACGKSASKLEVCESVEFNSIPIRSRYRFPELQEILIMLHEMNPDDPGQFVDDFRLEPIT